MSNQIDDKIVALDFDISRFKRGAKEAEDSIDHFNDKIKSINENTKSNNIFGEMNTGANDLSEKGLNAILTSLDNISNKYTLLGTIGHEAVVKLTEDAIEAGKKLVRSLSVDQVTESWSKYEDEISAVQLLETSLSSVLENSKSGKEYSMNEIEEYSYDRLNKLKWFADETSYSYGAMTNALAGFVRSGYTDVDKSISAIQGIATAAASAGVSISKSQELYSVWSTVASSGNMSIRQFDQLNKTYKAFTSDFKELLLATSAEQGKIKKLADGTYQTLSKGETVNIGNMRGYLKENIITSNVAMAALSKYGDVAAKLNELNKTKGMRAAEGLEYIRKQIEEATTPEKVEALKKEGMYFDNITMNAFEAAQACKTYGDAIDATKDAVSTQWAGIWKSLTGTYQEAKDLWTELCDYLWEIFVPFIQFLNRGMEFWHAWGGWEKLFSVDEDNYGAVWKLFNALLDIIGAIQEGIGRVFPIFATFDEECENYTQNVKTLAAWLVYYTDKFATWVESILPSEEQLEEISNMAEGVASLGRTIILGVRIGLKWLGQLLKIVWQITEPVRYFLQGVIESLAILNDSGKDLSNTTGKSFVKIGDSLMNIATAIKDFLYPVFMKLYELWQAVLPFLQHAFTLGSQIFGLITKLVGPIINGALSGITSLFKSLTAGIQSTDTSKIEEIGAVFSYVGTEIGNAFQTIGKWLEQGKEKLLSFGTEVITNLRGTAEQIGNFLSQSAMFLVDTLWNVLNNVLPYLWDKLMHVDWAAVAWKICQLALSIFTGVFGVLALKAIKEMAESVKGAFDWAGANIVGQLKKLFSGINDTINKYFKSGDTIKLLKQITITLAVMAATLVVFQFLDWERIIKGLVGLLGVMGILAATFVAITKSMNFISSGAKLGDAIGLGAYLNGMNKILQSIATAAVSMGVTFMIIAKAIKDNNMSAAEVEGILFMIGLMMGGYALISEYFMGMADKYSQNDKIKSSLKDIKSIIWAMIGAVTIMSFSMILIMKTLQSAGFNIGEAYGVFGIYVGLIGVMGFAIYLMSKNINTAVDDGKDLSKEKLTKLSTIILIISWAIKGIASSYNKIVNVIASNGVDMGTAWGVAGILSMLMMAFTLVLMGLSKFMDSKSGLNSSKTEALASNTEAAALKILAIAAASVLISFAISIMTVNLLALTITMKDVDGEQLFKTIASFGVIVLAILGSLALLNKQASQATFDPVNILALAASTVIISIAVSILAMNIQSIADSVALNPGAVWQAVAIIGLITALVDATVYLLTKLKATPMDWATMGIVAAGILTFSISMSMMVDAISQVAQVFTNYDPGLVWQGVASIMALMLVVFAIMGIMGELANNPYILAGMAIVAVTFPLLGIGLIGMANALNLMMPSIEQISNIETDKIWKAVGVISVLLLAFTLFGSTGGVSGPGLLLVAAGMYVFGLALQNALLPAIEQLGNIDWGVIGSAAGKLALLGLAISALGAGVGVAAIPVLIIAVALGILSLCLTALVAVATGFIDSITKMAETFNNLSGIKDKVNEFADSIPYLFQKVGEGMVKLVEVLNENKTLFGDAFSAILETIADVIIKSSGTITKAATDLINEITLAITKSVAEYLPQMKDPVMDIIKEVMEWIVQAAIASITGAAEGLFYGLLDMFKTIGTMLKTKGGEFKKAFKDMVDELSKLATWYLKNRDYIKEKMDPVWDELSAVIEDWIDPLAELLGEVIGGAFTSMNMGLGSGILGAINSWASNLWGNTRDAINNAENQNPITIGEMVNVAHEENKKGMNQILTYLAMYTGYSRDEINAMSYTGQQFAVALNKLRSSIISGKTKLSEDGKSMALAFINGYNETMGIHSPSWEMIQSGINTVAGLIQGIKEKAGDLWAIIKEIGGNALDKFRSALGLDSQGKNGETKSMGSKILEMLGFDTTDEDGKEMSLEDRFRNMLGLDQNESANDVLADILGENKDFNLNDWIGGDLSGNSSLFDDITSDLTGDMEEAAAASTTAKGGTSSSDKTSSSKNGTSSSNTNGRNGGQVYQNPQPGYTIIQNNYSPKALNSTEIYRRTKSTFAKLEGIKSV